MTPEHNEQPWDSFYEEYTLIKNDIADNAALDGDMFETYGQELEFVKNQDSKHVWTYLNTEIGVMIKNGIHDVNPIGFIVTKEPCAHDNILFVEYHDDED